MSENIDALLRDACTEILNMGIGRAAASLSEMLHEEVELHIPQLEILSREKAIHQFNAWAGPDITAISQHFSGDFSGDALLFFPQASRSNLLRSLLGDEVSAENITALTQDTLMEIGNIILNACFGTMSNVLQLQLNSGLPHLIQGRGQDLLTGDGDRLLISYVHFGIQSRDIEGYVSFIMDLGNFQSFSTHVRAFIERMTSRT